MADINENSSWRGVPLTDIYGSQSPWGAPEFPLISPSYNHSVLFQISDKEQDRPPKPQPGHDKWNKNFVRMPCSINSLYPVKEKEQTSLKRRWDIIEEVLKKPIKNSDDLAAAILAYNTKFKTVWKFKALHRLFNEYLQEEETEYFFNVTVGEIAKLTLALPRLIQSPIPLLRQHKNRAVSLSQLQISCLLANAFFCTFPRRNTTKRDSEYASYPHINFNSLYESSGSDAVLEKLKCICHYFRRVCSQVPIGVMTFVRHTVPPEQCPTWDDSDKFVGGTPLHVDAESTIEDSHGLIQVDFANKFLGGGVLSYGCVQEEIRFVINPELLISMLFTEVLDQTEALLMIGSERYSSYTGYGNTFQWAGDYEDATPFDSSRRKRCVILAIDALPLSRTMSQYEPKAVIRELNKAWVGMSSYVYAQDESRLVYPGIATGNWGCGAFSGSAHLKSILQLMACTEARRPMSYYTFRDIELRNDLINIYNLFSKYNVTVGQLYKYIIKFRLMKDMSHVSGAELHAYLHQVIVDQDGPALIKTIHNNCVTPSTTNETFSPDLFEDDEMLVDAALEVEKAIDETKESTVQIAEQEKKEEKELLNSPSLFDEITSYDNENGKLNLSDRNDSCLSNLNKKRENCETLTSSNNLAVSETSVSINKRKIGKKITDYFNKKPS